MALKPNTLKMTIYSLIAIALLVCAAVYAADEQDTNYRYLINPSDKLQIIIWPYNDLTMEVQVRPDGMISYPFIGEFKVEGMTAGELGEKITETIKEYVNEPKVAVNLIGFRQPRVYVLGQVNKPGQYDIRKGDTVLDAITAAGGPTKRATMQKIGLIRPTEEREKNKAKVTVVNLATLLGKGEIPPEFMLTDGDIIYVPETSKPNWEKIAPIVATLYQTFAIDDMLKRLYNF